MEDSERNELKRRLGSKRLKEIEKDFPEYAFIKEAYMGLPLPLRIWVRELFISYYLVVIEISLIFAILAAFSSYFPSIFVINKLVIGVIVFIITFFVLWQIRRSLKYEARVFKEMREPEEIKKRRSRRTIKKK